METKALRELFTLAKDIKQPKKLTNFEKALTYELTLKIAYACENVDQFVDAVLLHRYPAISLTQVEADFLKAGGLPEGLKKDHSLFKQES